MDTLDRAELRQLERVAAKRRFERVGVAVTLALVVGVLVLAVGVWQGWFQFSIHKDQNMANSKRVDMTFSVDEKKIDEDADAVVSEMKKLGQKAKVAIELKSHKELARWKNGCKGSRGIALDEKRGLLFVGKVL